MIFPLPLRDSVGIFLQCLLVWNRVSQTHVDKGPKISLAKTYSSAIFNYSSLIPGLKAWYSGQEAQNPLPLFIVFTSKGAAEADSCLCPSWSLSDIALISPTGKKNT